MKEYVLRLCATFLFMAWWHSIFFFVALNSDHIKDVYLEFNYCVCWKSYQENSVISPVVINLGWQTKKAVFLKLLKILKLSSALNEAVETATI